MEEIKKILDKLKKAAIDNGNIITDDLFSEIVPADMVVLILDAMASSCLWQTMDDGFIYKGRL